MFSSFLKLFGHGTPPTPPPMPLPTLSSQIDESYRAFTSYVHGQSTLTDEGSIATILSMQDSLIQKLKKANEYIQQHSKNSSPEIRIEIEALQKKLGLASTIDSLVASLLPSVPKPTIYSSPSSPTPTISRGIGIPNGGANCWANSLLQMISVVPELESAYQGFAISKLTNGGNDTKYAQHLLDELDALKKDRREGKIVSSVNSQNIRSAICHFFPGFSPSISAHEDAHAALTAILGGYSLSLGTKHNPLATQLHTRQRFQPTDLTAQADLSRINTYSKLQADQSSLHEGEDWEIFLDPQGGGDISFGALLQRFFVCDERGSGTTAQYLESNSRTVRMYRLTQVERQFQAPPQQFLLTVKRYETIPISPHEVAKRKIDTPIHVPLFLKLPEGAIRGSSPQYELDSFIVHHGSLTTGHYISYQKIGDVWIECNDSRTRIVSVAEIERILPTSYIYHYHRTDRTPTGAPLSPGAAAFVEPSPLYRYEIPSSDPLAILERQIAQLNMFKDRLYKSPPPSIKELSEEDRNLLEEMVWVRDKMPNVMGYGSSKCISDIGTLLTPCPSFIFGRGLNLMEQLIAKKTTQLHDVKRIREKVNMQRLLDALNNPRTSESEVRSIMSRIPKEIRDAWDGAIYEHDVQEEGKKHCNHADYGRTVLESNIRAIYDVNEILGPDALPFALRSFLNRETSDDVLHSALRRLSEQDVWALHGNVYQAHVLKFGRQACNKPEYGKVKRETAPRVLLSVVESGKNLVEASLDASDRASDHDKLQLESFVALMRNPSITDDQLICVFNHVPNQSKLLEQKWIRDGRPSGSLTYGMDKFKENPHCLLPILEDFLAGKRS